MTPAAIIEALERRGVRLDAEGERLIYDAPAGDLTPADFASLGAFKMSLLTLIRQRQRYAVTNDDGGISDSSTRTRVYERVGFGCHPSSPAAQDREKDETVDPRVTTVDAEPEAIAWLLYSSILHCELWLAPDAAGLRVIADDVGRRLVFPAVDIPALRGRPAEELRAVADAKAIFPETEIVSEKPATAAEVRR